jgi:hypothetical protein
MVEPFDVGSMHEGVVEMDPLTGRMVLRCEDAQGAFHVIDVQERLEKYKGEYVRFIVTPLSTVARLTKMVEEGDLALDEVPRPTKTY